MTTHNTGNPVPSAAVKDLYDNAENLDSGINGDAPTWVDRKGRTRKSMAGVEQDFQQFLADGSTIEFPTWAGASAAAGAGQIPLNRQVAVIGDAGTHVDLVSGEEVPNSGRYLMTEAGLQFRSADVLSQKADKTAVAELAGEIVSGVRRDFIEADQDPQGNVAFAIHRDGTREFIRTKVGGYSIERNGEESALIVGRASNRGVYDEYSLDLTGTAFADAIEIDVDDLGRVGRIKWKEGAEEVGSMRGRHMSDFRISGVNARVVTSDGYGIGRDTLMILCHGNTKNYTYAPNDTFKAWARANRVSYACISLQEGGTTGWGNDVSRNRVVALYQFLMERYRFHPSVVLAGDSMGGLVMGQLAYYRPFPVRFCLGIGPVPSLNYIFANAPARLAAIRSAFGMAADGSDDARAAEFFAGYDWFNMGMSESTPRRKFGFPRTHLYAGSGDSTYSVDFGGDLNYPILRDSLRAAGGFCNLTIVPGVSHDNDVLWNNVLEDGIFQKEIG